MDTTKTGSIISPRKEPSILTKISINGRSSHDLEIHPPSLPTLKEENVAGTSSNVGQESSNSSIQLLNQLYEDANAYRNKLVVTLDVVSRDWSRHMPVDDTSLKHAHKCALKAIKSQQQSPAAADSFLLHLLGDPLRPTGIFNEIRLENIVRSHIYNQDLCNKVYDEAFATMFDRVSDRNFGIEYWNAQQVKVQNTLSTSLKGPTVKMYLNEFNRRAKRDVAIVQAFRSIHDRLDALKVPTNHPSKPEEPSVPAASAAPAPLKELPTLQKRESESIINPDLRVTSPVAEQSAVTKHSAVLQQMKEIITNRGNQLEQVKNKATSMLLEDMQVNVLMDYVTRLKQSKTKYVQIIEDVRTKLAAIRRGIDCQKGKSTCESEWGELMSRVKTSEVEEQKVMKLLQNNISLATKLMSVINCYKDFYTISKMFEREIETKNEEYKSLREMLNDKNSHTDKALLTNIKTKKTDICQFVDQCLAKTNKESYLNRMSFVFKRFEECMQARNEVNTEETIANWFHRKREEMKTKETQLRQDVELLQKSLVTFDLLIGEAEKTLSTREHFKKDYIYVCLEGSETYQLKYLCAAYESQTYQIFNDIGEEQMNKKPLFEGKCTSRFLSKMEARVNNQNEKGTGFIFDGHRFFCNDFFEYRCWKSYILTGHDLRQEQLEWNDQQERKDADPQNEQDGSDEIGTNKDGSGPSTPRTRLRQRRASMSVMT